MFTGIRFIIAGYDQFTVCVIYIFPAQRRAEYGRGRIIAEIEIVFRRIRKHDLPRSVKTDLFRRQHYVHGEIKRYVFITDFSDYGKNFRAYIRNAERLGYGKFPVRKTECNIPAVERHRRNFGYVGVVAADRQYRRVIAHENRIVGIFVRTYKRHGYAFDAVKRP